jgi:outer membrane protein OmpA-like peptidoglycan-associated protein
LLSTKTASRIIADVYAVRKDYLDARRSEVQSFVYSLIKGEEALRDLLKNKATQQTRYRQLLARSADLLLGAPQATADVEALLGDCEFVGYSGNVSFFTGKGTTRNFDTLRNEIQSSFLEMRLITAKVPLDSVDWDYAALARGLKYAKDIPEPKKRFDVQKVTAKVEKQISVEPTTWEEEGTLFVVEISFEPNQSTFPESKYLSDFQKALEIAQTYSGGLAIIEGHSDPLKILRAEQDGVRTQEVEQMTQEAKNLSLERAQAVRESFLSYCRKRNFAIDDSAFVAIGLGIETPKFNPPRTREEWAANRRVVFRIKQVEAELEEFMPLQ